MSHPSLKLTDGRVIASVILTLEPGLVGVLSGMLEVGSPNGWKTGAQPWPMPPVQLGFTPLSPSSPSKSQQVISLKGHIEHRTLLFILNLIEYKE